MNFRLIFNTMGYILWVEAGFLMLPPVVAMVYGENCWLAFLLTATLCGIVGTLLHLVKPAQSPICSPGCWTPMWTRCLRRCRV